jgi:hypothetical protein
MQFLRSLLPLRPPVQIFPQLYGPQINASGTHGARREKVFSLFQKIFSHPAGKEVRFPAGKVLPAGEAPERRCRQAMSRRSPSAGIRASIFYFPPFWILIETRFLRA